MGALFSIAGLIWLIVLSVKQGTAWHIVGSAVFGSSLIILYSFSTLYHSVTNPRVKRVFARLDHVAIFLLIAGTYTPFLLTTLRGPVGWTLFGVIWALALIGVIIRSIYLTRFRKLMVVLYLLMGWMIVFAIVPMTRALPTISTVFLVAGGCCYTLGVVFYAWRQLNFSHGIWHLFVLAGSGCHFFSVLTSFA
ncbi:MAG: hemolysin III family protein [Phycisphaerae bacterium]|nr:hemolysin III family protein [Phycisphaerae bacterium]